jgi:hypothetical protein
MNARTPMIDVAGLSIGQAVINQAYEPGIVIAINDAIVVEYPESESVMQYTPDGYYHASMNHPDDDKYYITAES